MMPEATIFLYNFEISFPPGFPVMYYLGSYYFNNNTKPIWVLLAICNLILKRVGVRSLQNPGSSMRREHLIVAFGLFLLCHVSLGRRAYKRSDPQPTRRQLLAERHIEDLRAKLDDHHHRRVVKSSNYQCSDCLKEADGSPKSVRFMVMDKDTVIFNPMAKAKAKELGIDYNCDNAKLAVPECFQWKNWRNGWTGEMWGNIVEQLNLNVTLLTRANFTDAVKAQYKGSSSFTRCVWEIKLGNVDMCVGDFWETKERRSLVSFTASMDSDVFKLATLSLGKKDEFVVSDLMSIFDPFDRSVWAVNAAMVVLSAFLIWAVETTDGSPNNEDYMCQLVEGRQLTKMEGLGKSIWLALLGYVSGGSAHISTNWAGRLIVLGFGWFIYISVSSYTANLASFMISVATAEGLISSYSDIGLRGGALCGLEAIGGMVSSPGMTFVGFDNLIPAIEGMYDKRCLGTMVGGGEWKAMVRGAKGSSKVCNDANDAKKNSVCADPKGSTRLVQISGCLCKDKSKMPNECPDECPDHMKYCNLLEVLDPAFNYYVNWALPTIEWLEPYMSAWIINYKQTGDIIRMYQQNVDNAYPDLCGEGGGSMGKESEGKDATPLNIKSMAGTFVISGGIMLIGLIVHVISLCRLNKSGAMPDADHMKFNAHLNGGTVADHHISSRPSHFSQHEPGGHSATDDDFELAVVDNSPKALQKHSETPILDGGSQWAETSSSNVKASVGFLSIPPNGEQQQHLKEVEKQLASQQKQLDVIARQIADMQPIADQMKQQQSKLNAVFDLLVSMAEKQSNPADNLSDNGKSGQRGASFGGGSHVDDRPSVTAQAGTPTANPGNPLAAFLGHFSGNFPQ